MTLGTDILREVSIHVLNTIPVKPLRYETLKSPLGFLTNRCKREPSTFTQREKDVSDKILGWQYNLDSEIRNDLIKLDQKRTKDNQYFFPPLVVRAKSGLGKSVLLGKVMSELIDSANGLGEENWPSMRRIVFSQIKDNTSFETLEESICQGMDVYHRRENFDFMFSDTESIPPGEKIILIDSLDEHPNRADWWNVTKKLSNEGWKVIWSCRDPDWEIYRLSEKIPQEFKYDLQDGENYPWERDVPSWDLDYKNSPRYKDIAEQISELDYSDDSSIEQYIDYCYSTTQLMHIFYTNFDMIETARSDVDKLLMKTLLGRRLEFIDSNKEFYEKTAVFEDWSWYPQFFEANLSKIIIDTALDFLQSTDGWKAYDVEKIWLEICQDFYAQEFIRTRNFGDLSESIVRNSSFNKVDRNELMEDLVQLGILRATNKFRHRDFAVIAYIWGSDGLDSLKHDEKNDVLFQHFFPTEIGFDSSNTQNMIIEEFIRRTGNITAQIEPLCSTHDYPTNLLATRSKMIFDDQKGQFEKGLSRTQVKVLRAGENLRPIILKGFPGTGKTYTGVERILIRQANNVRNKSSSKPLIISLNEQLANSIHGDLYRQHKESPFLDLFDSQEGKMDVLQTIDVRSMKQIIEEWIPGISKTSSGDEWLLDSKALNEIFLEMHERRIFSVGDWRGLLRDFQKNLFDETTGLARSLNEVLDSEHTLPQADKTHSISEKIIRKKREEWYNRIRREINRGKFSLIRASVFLRNLLIKYEHQNSNLPESLWNMDYEPDPSIDIDHQSCFEHFETQFNSGKYDCVMIDEVQDMPAMAVICLSFLSPFRNPNQFILSGDHLQTLNGNPFVWEDFLKTIDFHAKTITSEVKHINNSSNHHLRSLSKLKDSLEEILEQHLTDNHRNNEAITEFTKFAWEKWPSSDFVDEETFPLSEMNSVKEASVNDTEIPRIMEIESANKDDFISKIEDVLEFLNTSTKISLLYANDFIQKYVREEIMSDESRSLQVESFTPWTIKGLERDAVVILGGYVAASADPDSRLLAHGINQNDNLQRKAIKLMRRKMLVSKTRAVDQLILLNAPREKSIDLSGNGMHFLQSLNPPRVSDFIETKKTNTVIHSSTVEAGDKIGMKLKEFFKDSVVDKELVSIVALTEGIDLSKRANNQADVKTELGYYHGRKSSIFDNDVSDSVLSEILFGVIRFDKTERLNDCLLLDDLLKQKSARSYIFNGESKPLGINSESDKYSQLVSYTLELLSNEGPWSKSGFDAIINIFTLINGFRNREQLLRFKNELIEQHDGASEEIEKIFDSFEALYHDYTSYLGIPKLRLTPSQIPAFLLSDKNEILSCEYSGQDIEHDVLQRFIPSMHDVSIDSKGGLFLNTGGNQFDISWQTMNDFLESILELAGSDAFESSPTNVKFAVNLTKLLSSFVEKIRFGGTNLNSDLSKGINKSNNTIIQLIIEMDSKDVIELCNSELANFINSGFGGLAPEVKKNILSKATNNSYTLHRVIDDDAVVKWKFDLFMEFVEILRQKGSSGSQSDKNRIRSLLIRGRHLIKEIQDGCAKVRKNQDHLNIYDLSTVLYFSLRGPGNKDRLRKELQEYFYLLSVNLSQPSPDGTWLTDKDSIRICMDLFMCVQLITSNLRKDPFVDFLKHEDQDSNEEGKNKHLGNVYQSLLNSLDLDFISQQIDKTLHDLERNIQAFADVGEDNHYALVDSVVGGIVLLQYLIGLRETKSGNTPFEQFEDNVSDILLEFPSLCRLFSDAGSNISPVMNNKSNLKTIFGAERILNNLYAQNYVEKAFTGGSLSNYKNLILNFDGFGGQISLNDYIEKNLAIIEPPRLKGQYEWIKLITTVDIDERFKIYKALLESIKHILYLNRTNDSTTLERLIKSLIFGPNKANDVFNIRGLAGQQIEVSIFEGDQKPIELQVEDNSVRLDGLWWSSDFVEGLRNIGLEISRVEGEKAVIDHEKTNRRIDELIELLDSRLTNFSQTEQETSFSDSIEQAEVLEKVEETRKALLKNNPFSPFHKSDKKTKQIPEYVLFGITREDWENTPENVKRLFREQNKDSKGKE